MYQVVISQVLKQGTKTFKFNSLVKAKDFANQKQNRLVDILERTNDGFVSLMF
jgi:hypothetical protein